MTDAIKTQEIVTDHPLIIKFQDAISGNGFLARITVFGRALMRKENDGQWWMYGVQPGGIAESGNTIEVAFCRFRTRYRETLIDIAQESRNFSEFRTEVERFFNETDEDAEAWEKALTAVRAGNMAVPPAPFSDLPRESAESRPSQIEVERLDREGKQFVPSDNITDEYLRAA